MSRRVVGVHHPQFLNPRRPPRRNRVAQAVQDDLGGFGVQVHVAPGGQERKALLHRAFNIAAGAAEQAR